MEDIVNHPSHYTQGFPVRSVECIDITRHLPFTLGNAFKYVWRAGKKGDSLEKALEDLDKADWYLEEWRQRIFEREVPPFRTAMAVFQLVDEEKLIPLEAYRYNALELLLLYVSVRADDPCWALEEFQRELEAEYEARR